MTHYSVLWLAKGDFLEKTSDPHFQRKRRRKENTNPEDLHFVVYPGSEEVDFSHLCTVGFVWQTLGDLCHKTACQVHVKEHTSVMCDGIHPVFYFNFLFLSSLRPNLLWNRMVTQTTKNAWWNMRVENNELLDAYNFLKIILSAHYK